MDSFEKSEFDFGAYLKTLPNKTAKYESWLKCVILPNLQCDLEHPDGTSRHTVEGQREASLIFNHLRKMNVERVFEVNVPDCLIHPHTNEAIINCLRGLHVKHLTWRKMDLSVATIMEAAPEVEELYLYSSGNMDVLSHWASYEGLYHLLKVCHLPYLAGYRRKRFFPLICQQFVASMCIYNHCERMSLDSIRVSSRRLIN
jgi:hypothetical protein